MCPHCSSGQTGQTSQDNIPDTTWDLCGNPSALRLPGASSPTDCHYCYCCHCRCHCCCYCCHCCCRAKLDSNAALTEFCADLEAAVIETIEAGKVTKDLAICIHGTTKVTPDQYLNTEAFMEAISATFQQKRSAKAKM